MKLDRILVAVDGSTHSLRAVEWTAGLALRTGAQVMALHAIGLMASIEDRTRVPAHRHRSEIVRELERSWCAPLSGVDHQVVAFEGDPVLTVLRFAEEWDVDLIVVGSRGAGGAPMRTLGSTSSQLAQGSSRPVTIVP